MKISVIVPTYKPGDYIYECLNSINCQTLEKEDFELILILNGCNEPYESAIKNYIADKLSNQLNINFIQTDKGGVSNARNIGLDVSKGEYITFIDDDDYISPSYLEELLQNAGKETVSLSNTIAFNDETSEIYKEYKKSEIFRKNDVTTINKARKYFSGPCMKMIHREIIGKKRYDEKFKLSEDSLFMFLISSEIKQCKFTSDKAIYYRRIRTNSAFYSKQLMIDVTKNQFNLIKSYSRIYFSNFPNYNLLFYLTRVLAGVKTVIHKLLSI